MVHTMYLVFRIKQLIKNRGVSPVFFIPENLHLLLVRKREEFLALCKNLFHEFLAYSMIDNVEKTGIQTCLKTKTKNINMT